MTTALSRERRWHQNARRWLKLLWRVVNDLRAENWALIQRVKKLENTKRRRAGSAGLVTGMTSHPSLPARRRRPPIAKGSTWSKARRRAQDRWYG